MAEFWYGGKWLSIDQLPRAVINDDGGTDLPSRATAQERQTWLNSRDPTRQARGVAELARAQGLPEAEISQIIRAMTNSGDRYGRGQTGAGNAPIQVSPAGMD